MSPSLYRISEKNDWVGCLRMLNGYYNFSPNLSRDILVIVSKNSEIEMRQYDPAIFDL
jgi:hypothetical protein